MLACAPAQEPGNEGALDFRFGLDLKKVSSYLCEINNQKGCIQKQQYKQASSTTMNKKGRGTHFAYMYMKTRMQSLTKDDKQK